MLNDPSATQTLAAFQVNRGSAIALLQACQQRITEREPTVRAWTVLDFASAWRQAERCDQARGSGQSLGALHGIPVGVKDTFATASLPTEWGTPIHAGRQFDYDAAVVERLHRAGAIVLGKTVTTEYAYAATRANKTTNPHHPDHTPGGSSSGSAAAVADGMVPVAIGTQMMGSVLRPAAYCGVIGFKPSFGTISRYGLMPSSRELDHVGIFAREIADIAVVLNVIAGVDDRDPDCYGTIPGLSSTLPTLPQGLRLAVVLGPHGDQMDADAAMELDKTVTILRNSGAISTDLSLPPVFDPYVDLVNDLAAAGMAMNHGEDYDRHADLMSAPLCHMIERGRQIPAIAYARARHITARYGVILAQIFSEFDAIITPVTTGAAPKGLGNTGSPVFCSLWTLCGLPAIAISVGKTADGLPLGIQVVGRRLDDMKLLAIADWMMQTIKNQ